MISACIRRREPATAAGISSTRLIAVMNSAEPTKLAASTAIAYGAPNAPTNTPARPGPAT